MEYCKPCESLFYRAVEQKNAPKRYALDESSINFWDHLVLIDIFRESLGE